MIPFPAFRLRIFLILSILLFPVGLYAEETFPLLLVTQERTSEIGEYGDLSIRIYSDLLLEQGIRAFPYEPPADTPVTIDELLEEARRQAMVFLAVNTLTLTGDTIVIDAVLIYTRDGSTLFETSSSGSVELGLERKLRFIASQASGAVVTEIEKRGADEVLEDQRNLEQEAEEKENTEPVIAAGAAAAAVVGAVAVSAPPDAGTVETPRGATEPAAEEPGETEAPDPAESAETTSPESTSDDKGVSAPLPSPRKWATDFTLAPVFPLGTSASYLSIGGKVNIGIYRWLPVGPLRLAPGFRTGVYYFRAQGAVRRTYNLVIDGQLRLLVQYPNRSAWHPFIGISGGVGTMGITDGTDPWMWKFVSTLGFQVGVDIAFSDGFSLVVSCDTSLIFESSVTIVALEPALGGRFSW